MPRLATPLKIFAVLALAGCAAQMTATTDFDPAVDFSAYRTFAWIDPNPVVRAATQRPLSPLIIIRLKEQTYDLLTARGLDFVGNPADADLAVAFTIGSREGIRITSYPTRSFQRGPGGRRYTWGGYWGGSNVRTRQYTEGQLAIDMFDVAEARPVWHGSTASRITPSDRERPDELISEALAAILADFPPR